MATTAAAQAVGPGAAAAGAFTLGAEALFLWFKNSPMPVPIVTNGAVGEPDTQTYLGGRSFDTGSNAGFRLSYNFV